MTNSEYQELVGFLGRKFEEVDRKLEGTATKEELRTHEANIRRHFDVMAEGLRGQIQQVAEGVANVEQELRRFRGEVVSEFAETRAAIRFSYAQLERRIQELETNYVALSERVGRLEARTA